MRRSVRSVRRLPQLDSSTSTHSRSEPSTRLSIVADKIPPEDILIVSSTSNVSLPRRKQSTSLVAIHSACVSLLTYQCDMALAGGVTTINILHGSANSVGGQTITIKMRWGKDAQGLIFEGAPPGLKLAMGENPKRSGNPSGRTATGADAVEWAKKVDSFGVLVILPTSKAGDGAKTGYDLPVIRAMKQGTSAQIVASGGAGKLEHFYEAVQAGATILLAASVFHFQMIGIQELRFHGPSWGSQTGAKQDETVVEFVQKLITVLVLDIRDFTGLSRRLPAERLSEVISTLMRESGVVLSEQNAWGQKYIGDAVMAIWLHPGSQPALADLLPVFRSLEGIVGIASRLQATLGLDEPIRVGAGINTGTACIGNMGSGASSDYTALSDTVNLAFRLEAATKEIEGDIALGARVYECLAAGADVSDLFQYQQVSLKGYKELKPAYGTHQSSLPELLARIQRSLAEPHLTPSGSIGAGVGA